MEAVADATASFLMPKRNNDRRDFTEIQFVLLSDLFYDRVRLSQKNSARIFL